MKKVLMLMLSLVASSASFATSAPTRPATTYSVAAATQLVMSADHKIRLYVQPLSAKGQLTIQDATNQTVYTQSVSLQKGLCQQFDVSSLGTGKFRLTLTTARQSLTRTFVIQARPNESFVVQ